MADLTEKDLENMKNHKYKSTGYTTLDNKMNPFWIKCASYLPYAYSPNMVTVTGLFCELLSIILISYFDLTFSKLLPPFVNVFCALMFFLSQTFDAIDGKHARNTKRSSSLGQLMDHGCDSMDNFIYAIVMSQAYLFGNSINTLLIQILIQIPFYTYTLEEHFEGILRTQMDDIGVTEVQFFSIGLLLLASIFGEKLIFFEILGIRLSNITLYFLSFCSIFQTIHLIILNSKNFQDAMKYLKHISTIIVFILAEFLTYKLDLYQQKPFLIVLLNGLYYSLFTCKLIISNMAKRHLNIFDIDIIFYDIGICACAFIKNGLVENLVLIALSIWIAYRYYTKIICSIFRLLDYLKISF